MRRWKLSIIMHEMIKVPLGRYQATCTRVPKGFSAGLCEGTAKGVGVGGGRRDSIVLARDAGSRQKVIIGITELSGNLGQNDKNKDLFWGPSCM